ncbi:MAG: glycosyltransferase family 2 protein [Proteobacteria bacterium]|nr:glycosyltransferase family 2 protein [Pseudomonadota bacterium]
MSTNTATAVSAILITRNEAHNLPACLAGLAWCDEIVVLDSGSTDETVEIARRAGAQVQTSSDWPGFGPQKNRVLELARCDWVLSIDADERVTPELAAEIRTTISGTDPCNAYAIARLSNYCGQFMRHGGWYPDRVVRLFKRGTARFSDDIVHESVQTHGRVGRLREDLLHISYRSFEDVLDKMNHYSTAGASKAAARGRSSNLLSAWLHSRWAFIRAYILRLGFLDGRLGYVLACSIAHETWYRYIKLWHRPHENLLKDTLDAAAPRTERR